MLDLKRPIYRQTAAYGHMGRTDIDLPWERTDKVAALQAALQYNSSSRFKLRAFLSRKIDKTMI